MIMSVYAGFFFTVVIVVNYDSFVCFLVMLPPATPIKNV